MNRKHFLQQASLASAALAFSKLSFAGIQSSNNDFPIVRISEEKRKFKSAAVESLITEIKSKIGNKEIAWMFENCFPNTLDTTVDFEIKNGEPDTYVITGDIDAMWLRDSTAQVFPYLPLCKKDKNLQQLIKGVINRQVKCILLDPYANAFYKDENKVSEWKNDLTEMKPGVHERKWEIDSLCYPIRLSYYYWQQTSDATVFDEQWLKAMKVIVQTFREQQRIESVGPYKFQRNTAWATDGVPLGGYGYPVKPNGLICSMFRPSDDATIFPYLVASNLFAAQSLLHLENILRYVWHDVKSAVIVHKLYDDIANAIKDNCIIKHPKFGEILAYEVNGFGSYNLMDDANIPSLLSLPYLGCIKTDKDVYVNTRAYLLSSENPFYFKGKLAEANGSPHTGMDMVWHLSIIMRGLTSTNDAEINQCLDMLQRTHAGTGFMHESFDKNNPAKFTRSWFAWANTLFGEFVWKVYKEKPQLLN